MKIKEIITKKGYTYNVYEYGTYKVCSFEPKKWNNVAKFNFLNRLWGI